MTLNTPNANHRPSLSEVHASLSVVTKGSPFRKFLSYFGPGLMIAVGYMDPGNWATDLAGGAQFGYLLLSVVLVSNLMAMLLQHLSLKLGLVTGRDLAQACRDYYSKPVSFVLWILCELAIIACDLAEVIGSALALHLLFNIPLVYGIFLTGLDVMLILMLQKKGFRYVEMLVGSLILLIGGCFIYELIVSHPTWSAVAAGFIPRSEIITNPSALYIAIGILGATVMPHNLYLHSSIVQTRKLEKGIKPLEVAVKYFTLDSCISLFFAFFINAAILVVSAAAFYQTPYSHVADINDAYKLLSPTLGAPFASTIFIIALLASGLNSTLTGTLAGQVVMEGFLNITWRPWLRRLVTRMVAIVPAIIVALIYGEKGIGKLLIFSQVVLSLQLSFAVFPLISFTSDREKMKSFVNGTKMKIIAWAVGIIIAGLNLYLFTSMLFYGV
ncbi:MAG: Nramp family divalent metal transporter [Bacteriovoracaceae bacterium]|nr:Nramp family divalent metal transporter [Bacteriovoracaceae bacterium]